MSVRNSGVLVFGFGLNDLNESVYRVVDGKHKACDFYKRWQNMLQRCYSKKFHEKKPAYIDCFVCEEWLSFSSFKAWMSESDWRGKDLDKDLLFPGNKLYSPETCAFIDTKTNRFLVSSHSVNGEFLIGTSFDKGRGKFISRCRNPFTNKMKALGYYHNEIDAHLAWKKHKHELACQLAELQTDPRVAKALMTRYL